MALRSPVLFHNFWGTANAAGVPWVSGQLPNEGAPPTNTSPNVQIGDFAYVAGVAPDTGTFYICTNAGDPVLGGAVWIPLTTGAPTVDRFGPKHLVGYAAGANPDSNVPFSANGFHYYPDNGTGDGIRAALLAASTLTGGGNIPGDVWIRPGNYAIADTDAPFVVPPNTRVQGAGQTTVINKFSADANSVLTVFSLLDKSELRDIVVTQVATNQDAVYQGSGVIEVNIYTEDNVTYRSNAQVERVYVQVNDSVASPIAHTLAGFFVQTGCSLTADRCNVLMLGAGGSGAPETNGFFCGWRIVGDPQVNYTALSLDDCTSVGGQAAVTVNAFTGTDVNIDQCDFRAFTKYGVFQNGGDLAVTGGTLLQSDTTGAKGIRCYSSIDNQSAASAMISARVKLSNLPNGTEYGIELSVDSGQITGSRVEAASGIVSQNPLGRGVAIGFNSVISQAGQQIVAQLVDEVAHNILST